MVRAAAMTSNILSIEQIGAMLADAVDMKMRAVCVYGSDAIPENSIRYPSLSNCLAHRSKMYNLFC